MLNTTHTTQNGDPSTIEYVIRVKSGNLAPKGKGTLTIGMMPDGKVNLSATLPNESGEQEPFDFTSLERLELVRTRKGFYQGKQWIGPAIATVAAVAIPPIVAYRLFFTSINLEVIFPLFALGCPYLAGFYAGSKLSQVARCVAIANDGRHCIVEMPEIAYYLLRGIEAAEDLDVEMPAADTDTNSEVADATPAPA